MNFIHVAPIVSKFNNSKNCIADCPEYIVTVNDLLKNGEVGQTNLEDQIMR